VPGDSVTLVTDTRRPTSGAMTDRHLEIVPLSFPAPTPADVKGPVVEP
jgi:hypothetical protein